jgi:4-oxalocrotonate tautomerase
VKPIEALLTPEQKEEVIRRLTETMVSIEGESVRPVTWVILEEVKSGEWGVGGNPLTTAVVRALAAGNSTRTTNDNDALHDGSSNSRS